MKVMFAKIFSDVTILREKFRGYFSILYIKILFTFLL